MPRRRPRPGDVVSLKDLFRFKTTWTVWVKTRDGKVREYGRSGKYSEEELGRKVKVKDVWILYKVNWLYICEEVV
ncbi:hypothetical protein PNA2_1328 [Pyrococcus sp. NA2]|uniref:hypothetical protein n=1 Tax=Pyrococcus sp. (strain NA2) TaxID=342949 RepID=UPI000209ADF7|nr:hypothetical protein [Pyrococcus sp. NA2]AEC52243.1 hypothetical protein PNA2_1328 [Pyrococcus sp. NA2]